MNMQRADRPLVDTARELVQEIRQASDSPGDGVTIALLTRIITVRLSSVIALRRGCQNV